MQASVRFSPRKRPRRRWPLIAGGIAGLILLALWPQGEFAPHGLGKGEDAPAIVEGPALVHDGDTLTVAGRRIRLHGVDAPELDQTCQRDGVAWPCGRDAAFTLGQRVAGRLVSCRTIEPDRFGRLVAHCTVEGESLNRWLVREGWAVAYRRYSHAYVLDEWIARWHGRGLWAGSFERPEDWRHRR